jgi:hypothetical protein
MDLARIDRIAARAQIPFTVGGYIGWGYILWPKGAVLFGSPRNVNWMAVFACGIFLLGALSAASQMGLLTAFSSKKSESKATGRGRRDTREIIKQPIVAAGPSIPLVAVEAPQLPAIPEPVELTDSDRPEQAGVLFAHNPEKGVVWLKFLPDTARVNEDVLLLVVFGYKLIRKENEVSVKNAEIALHWSGCVADPPRGFAATFMWMNYDRNVDVDHVGRACVERGLLYKGGLARGGIFVLTEGGARHALHLAKDMIQRA